MSNSTPNKTPLAILSRRETFSSAHRLHSKELSLQQNQEIYGKCNHPNFHGHNYVLEVFVKGPISPETGMVMNLADLKVIIKKKVLDRVDHRNLDLDIDHFQTVPSTTENLAVWIWHQLVDEIPNKILYQVKLAETENNVVIYQGE